MNDFVTVLVISVTILIIYFIFCCDKKEGMCGCGLQPGGVCNPEIEKRAKEKNYN